MRKFSFIILSSILIIFLFVSCNNTSNDKSLSLNKCNSSIIENQEFFINTLENELIGNIYMMQDNSKQYIVFYQMNINPNNIVISIENSIIRINLIDDPSDKDIYVYEISNYKYYEDYTLKIMKNNKEMIIKTVLL